LECHREYSDSVSSEPETGTEIMALELAVSLYVDPDPALTFAAIAAADIF